MDPSQRCPYCAEEVAPTAVRCPHCRSALGEAGPWHRDQPERRLAGVAAALGRGLGLPVGAVRLAFVVLSFVHLFGALAYSALWLLIPFGAEDESVLERALGRAKDGLRELRRGTRRVLP